MTTHLTFGLLGDLEIRDGDRRIPLNGGKLRVLLAALLLRANQPVSHDELAVRLWDDRPPGAVRGTLHAYALRLRRALGDDRRAPRLIVTRPQGYAIRIDPHDVDVLRFRALLDGVFAGGPAADPAAEARRLDEALRLWRGAALRDIESESLHREVVPHLVEQRLRAWERRLEIDLELGRHAEVVAELTALTGEYPLHEGFWCQLLVALCRCGRQAEALERFHQARRHFNDELGVDPGERLQRLCQNILAGLDPLSGRPPRPVRAIPAAAHVAQPPPGVHGFIGRSRQLALLRDWAAPAPAAVTVVVISGAPGVGKSALALHAAHRLRARFPDGRLHVNLRGHTAAEPLSPAAALTRLLRRLGVPDDRIPGDQDDLAALYRSVLGERRVLLLLDDAATAAQVRPLLPGHPGSVVLVTSRNELRGLTVTQGGHRLPLPPLAPEESYRLLARLVGDARAAAEPRAVARLAELCTHLPLALRIAGAHLAANPCLRVGDYADRLRYQGRVAALSLDDDPETNLREVLHGSYARLPAEVKHGFLGLTGLLPPCFTLACAARRLRLGPGRLRPILDHLVGAGLLREPSPAAYEFNELIWEYGAALAAGTPWTRTTATRPTVTRAGESPRTEDLRNGDMMGANHLLLPAIPCPRPRPAGLS